MEDLQIRSLPILVGSDESGKVLGVFVNYKQALGLGFELTSFFLISYVAYPTVADTLGWDVNLTLGLLFGLSLVIWTLHAFLYTNTKSE